MIRLSPDGGRFTVALLDPESGNQDLWLSDANGAHATRFTFDPANDSSPVWSPDGRHLARSSNRGRRLPGVPEGGQRVGRGCSAVRVGRVRVPHGLVAGRPHDAPSPDGPEERERRVEPDRRPAG